MRVSDTARRVACNSYVCKRLNPGWSYVEKGFSSIKTGLFEQNQIHFKNQNFVLRHFEDIPEYSVYVFLYKAIQTTVALNEYWVFVMQNVF